MKTIRVFVSSTGDVQKERILADRVIRSVAAEFNVPVSAPISNFQRLAEENGESKTESENHGTLILCPYFLEYQRFQSEAGCRGQIPNTAEFDLVISILWSRLGALLDPTLTMPDGSSPGSGTEYEVAWALDHAKKNRGVPLLRVYRNCSKPTSPSQAAVLPKSARLRELARMRSTPEANWSRQGSSTSTLTMTARSPGVRTSRPLRRTASPRRSWAIAVSVLRRAARPIISG